MTSSRPENPTPPSLTLASCCDWPGATRLRAAQKNAHALIRDLDTAAHRSTTAISGLLGALEAVLDDSAQQWVTIHAAHRDELLAAYRSHNHRRTIPEDLAAYACEIGAEAADGTLLATLRIAEALTAAVSDIPPNAEHHAEHPDEAAA